MLSGRIFGARCWEDLWGLELTRDPYREADSEYGLRSHDPDTPCQCPDARHTLTVACEFPQDRRREGPAGPRVRGILRSSARARWHVRLRLRLWPSNRRPLAPRRCVTSALGGGAVSCPSTGGSSPWAAAEICEEATGILAGS